MLTLLMHLRSPGFSGVRFAVFCVMFHRSLFVMLVIVLSVPFRFIVSDYHFGIFNLFLSNDAFIVLLVWYKYNDKNWMHSFEVSLRYESVDRTTFSTWSAIALHWKCTSVNAFIPQWNFKRMHSILNWNLQFLNYITIKTKVILF